MLPFLNGWGHLTGEQIDALRLKGDYRALTDLLGNRHTDVQWRAAEALEASGYAATGFLIRCLDNRYVQVRLGALEALSGIQDKTCTEAVIKTLGDDPSTEVRWAAAITLGQLYDNRAIGPLRKSLHHPDKYVRFGSAEALKNLGWKPATDEEQVDLLFALQDWAGIRKVGRPAIPLLIRSLSDKDRDIRKNAITILGEMRAPELQGACDLALADADGGVRWKAVLTSKKCGVAALDLPFYVGRRRRTRPSPLGAAVLNLCFPGLGYNYLGRWWGFLFFVSFMTTVLLFSIEVPLDLPLYSVYPYPYTYPITIFLAYHAYTIAKKMPDL